MAVPDGREVANAWSPAKGRPQGHDIFTGATASLRGSPICGVRCAKHRCGRWPEHGTRARPARHPRRSCDHRRRDRHGFIRENFPERYALKERDGILNPDHIADAYWMLHRQPRDAWTHELDLRPWMEKF